MVGLICVHQLLEYIGTVALWSWLAELVPPRIRGRFFSRRQIWQLAVLIPTLWTSGVFADRWRAEHGRSDLLGYAWPIGVGVGFLLVSIVPLARMPATLGGRWIVPPRAAAWKSLLAPLADARFRWWLAYGCWFSFFNGVTQSAQNIYPKRVLDVGLREQAEMRTLMQLGQAGVSFWAGPASDRYGNRPVLIASQLLVATGPLFFLLATPAQPNWLYGAWIVWAAYAGINICQPNLTLKLAGGNSAPYVATYFAVTSICYAASTVAGGYLFNLLGDLNQVCLGTLTIYQAIFLFGWLSRTLGVVWLLMVDEPGAWTWRRILRRPRR
jgi:MFS family permease